MSEPSPGAWEPQIPIIANGSNTRYNPASFSDLVRDITQDILQQPLQWDIICANCVTSVAQVRPQTCAVLPVGIKSSGSSLLNALCEGADLKASMGDRYTPKTQRRDPKGSLGKSKIAIVGMSGRFPDAMNPSIFWDLLKAGLHVHREVPSDRFDARAHYDPTGKRKNTSHTPYGCFIEHPGHFDAKFFSMSPKEALQTDPMHRLALMTAVGTFYGQTSDDWREIQDGQHVQTYFIPGGVRAFAPGRINYHFGFSGPSFSVDTACSSSLAAINIAWNSLWLVGELNRLQREMAYRLFSVLVDYQDVYKGMAEVVSNGPQREGKVPVDLRTGKDGTFFVPQYHIDSLYHLAGFIMNANYQVDASTVFDNHGWESLRFIEQPSPNKKYRSYVRMQPTGPESKDYSCDVHVFDEGVQTHWTDRGTRVPVSAKANTGSSSATGRKCEGRSSRGSIEEAECLTQGCFEARAEASAKAASGNFDSVRLGAGYTEYCLEFSNSKASIILWRRCPNPETYRP